MPPVYIGSVSALVGYPRREGLLRDMDNKTLAALIDPFGVARRLARDRVLDDRREQHAARPVRRACCCGTACCGSASALVVAGALLLRASASRTRDGPRAARRRPRRRTTSSPTARSVAPPRRRLVACAACALLPRLTWMYLRETVKNVYFGVFALAGVLFLVASEHTVGSIFGTTT